MTRRRTRLLALVLLLAGAASAASAQQSVRDTAWKRLSLAVRGGVVTPVFSLDNGFHAGWSAGAHVAYRPRFSQFGIRLEGSFDRLAGKSSLDSLFRELSGSLQMVGGTASAQLFLREAQSRRGPVIRPYVIGGVGLYNMRFTDECDGGSCGDATHSEQTLNKLGLTGGIGAELRGLTAGALIEIRWVDAMRALTVDGETRGAHWVRIDFGLRIF
jgi:hypothetical protein